MNSVFDFYTAQIQKYEEDLLRIKKNLVASGIIRLLIFTGTILLFYLFFDSFKSLLSIGLIGGVVFTFFVKRHTQLKAKKAKLIALIEINKTEIFIHHNNAQHLAPGTEFLNPQHKFSYDIDLFGNGSFFQYLNRTATRAGKKKLANTLSSNNIDNILSKQEAITELSKTPEWRQEYTATAKLVHIETKSETIVSWMENYTPVIPKAMAYIPLIFGLTSIGVIAFFLFDIINVAHFAIWVSFGLGISGRYYQKVTILSQNANRAKDTFKQYYQLLQQIESTPFQAQLLAEKKQLLKNDHQTVSVLFHSFSRILDALDQRNNLLFGFVANAFSLWDLMYSYKTEQWILQNQSQIKKIFDVIAFFDAQNSLANYAFNHPKHTFPIIKKSKSTITSKKLGHPLLAKDKRIDNDFSIQHDAFYIITGANMAGKSTFLRAVSISIVMANTGLPVCAESYTYSPIKLITSMRTSDSLSEDESYFFSELKRLKFIIDAIGEEKHFIVLDEILKGTNSTDKALGSRKFVKKLVDSQSTGIIATHDLSLCEITVELSQVVNYYFDAEIINDELYFDYTLKEGICQNMNASFLLTKMKII